MILIKKNNRYSFKLSSLLKLAILLYICSLYSTYEIRLVFELILFITSLLYFFPRLKRPSIYFYWNICFISCCLASLMWSKDLSNSIIKLRIIIECAIVGNILISFIDNREKLLFIYKSFVIAGIILIIRLSITFPINTWIEGRLGNEVLNPNKIGLYLSISTIFCIQLLYSKNKNIIYKVLPIIFAITVALTGSRKAILMLIIGSLGLYYINSKNISKKIKALFITVIVLVASYMMIMNIPTLYNIIGIRIESMVNALFNHGYLDKSMRERTTMIEIGINLFKENPIFGHGVGSYSKVSGLGVYSHNNYIELLSGIGLIGTFTYYSIYLYTVLNIYKMKRNIYANSLLIILLLLAINEFALVSYLGEVYQMIIPISIATLKINKNNKRQKSIEEQL